MESQDEKLSRIFDGVYDCLVNLIDNPLGFMEKCKSTYETYCMNIATHIMTKSSEKDYCGYKKLEEAKNNGNKIGLNCVKKGISTKLILKVKEEVDKEPLNKMLFKYQCLLWDCDKLLRIDNILKNRIIVLERQVKEANNNREVQISENRNLRKKIPS